MQLYKKILSALVLLIVGCGTKAFAGPIFFDFNGGCTSAFGNGCSTFGLSEGENVSGVFSFDESLVIPGSQIQPIGSSTPDIDFSLTFGDVLFTKSDLIDLTFTVVEFSIPDASSLVGFGTQGMPVEYAVGIVDPFSLVVFGGDPESQVFVREIGTDVFINGAFAVGIWTRRQSTVPEPHHSRSVRSWPCWTRTCSKKKA